MDGVGADGGFATMKLLATIYLFNQLASERFQFMIQKSSFANETLFPLPDQDVLDRGFSSWDWTGLDL
jgi:hypothetical protein